jgi:hypothetical protein
VRGRRSRAAAAGAACLALALPAAGRAQGGAAERPGALAFGLGVGGPLADAANRGCGTVFSFSATVGMRWRAWRNAIVDATLTRAAGAGSSDCLSLDAVNADGSYLRSIYERNPDDGTTAAALRTGLEGGGRWVRGRVLVGLGGMLQQQVVYRTAMVSGSLGPRAARLRVDVEGWWYRLPVHQVREAVVGGRWVQTPVGGTRRVGERAIATRVGLDVPFGERR